MLLAAPPVLQKNNYEKSDSRLWYFLILKSRNLVRCFQFSVREPIKLTKHGSASMTKFDWSMRVTRKPLTPGIGY